MKDKISNLLKESLKSLESLEEENIIPFLEITKMRPDWIKKELENPTFKRFWGD